VTLEEGATNTLDFVGKDRIGRLVIGGTPDTTPGTCGHSSANPTYAFDAVFSAGSGLYEILPWAYGTVILVK